MLVRSTLAALLVLGVGATASAASAQPQPSGCSRAVIFTLPGITWADIEEFRPPAILGAVEDGATASMSVRTVLPTTSYGSGFATIGAGNRVEAGRSAGGQVELPGGKGRRARAAGLPEIQELAEEAAYGAVPGALGSALGDIPTIAIGNADPAVPVPAPAGYGRWALLAAMDAAGIVDVAYTSPRLLHTSPADVLPLSTDQHEIQAAVTSALTGSRCSLAVVDQGDLERAEQLELLADRRLPTQRRGALFAADRLLAHTRSLLDEDADVLIVASPTAPAWDDGVHLGVAIAVGPRFPPGATLSSPSTRRAGIVTLPDIAPTVLAHLGLERPAAMSGRSFFAADAENPDARIANAIEFDEEAVFVDELRTPVVTGFVVFQILAYLLTIAFLSRRESRGIDGGLLERLAQLAALALVAFPATTYLAGALPQHRFGTLWFISLLLVTDLALVAVAWLAAKRPLDRLLVLAAGTTVLLLADLLSGSHLQLNTFFGYSPLVAGRFAGIGNIGFSVLSVSALITGALVVHRARGARRSLLMIAALFIVVIVVDGAPPFGSDVGGVLALVPGLGITWFLLSGRRPSWQLAALTGLGALVVLALFVALDLSRPDESRTHLGRFVEDIRRGGASVLANTIERKARTNLRVFRSTIWTYLVPPLLAAVAWLLFRPRGRWHRLARMYPRLHAGLVGSLFLALFGFLVNDSGIVVPAVILSFIVPMALLMHLSAELRVEP